jgi:glutaredoxin
MFTIYSTSTCQWCKKAEQTLVENSESFVVKNVAIPANLEEYRAKTPPGTKSVPQIFDEDTYVGGYEALVLHLRYKK